ncbi:MAG: hypothetical protein R2757_14010 [Draconibacterium sp.]
MDENYYRGVLLSLENQLSFMKISGDPRYRIAVQHVRKSDGNSVGGNRSGLPLMSS